jgi:hypothetical protein
MARTSTERLQETNTELETAFRLINEIWTNESLNLSFIDTTKLTAEQRELREKIVSCRIAIMNACNQVELLLENN